MPTKAIVKFEPSDPVIILQTTLAGKIITTARMALDTGASYVMIPWKIAQALGLKPETSPEKTSIITASGTEIVPVISIQSINLAGLKIKNVKAVVHDLPPSSYVDGLLGLSFLKYFKLSLDFKKGILILE